jgi:hypothetical protein
LIHINSLTAPFGNIRVHIEIGIPHAILLAGRTMWLAVEFKF